MLLEILCYFYEISMPKRKSEDEKQMQKEIDRQMDRQMDGWMDGKL